MFDLQYIFDQFLGPAVFTFVIGVIFVLLALKFFPRLGLMDRPHLYGHDRKPIPYYGGVAIFLAFLVSTLVFVPIDETLIGLLTAASFVVLIGFFDDLFNLSPWVRLAIQFFAGAVLVAFGIGIFSINLPLIGMIEFGGPEIFDTGLKLFAGLFTIVWVVLIINAMNFVDGVSGLNSGVTFIAGITIFLLSIHPLIHEDPSSQMGVAMLALILAMVALAFWIFDFPPAKILMGDTGSTFFGFMIGALAIFSGGKVATAFLVLGIAILDAIWVIVRRISSGKKFWQGDRMHLHHRLLKLKLSERQVVLLYLAITAFFGISAIFLVKTQQKVFMLIALLLLMLLLAIALTLIPKRRRKNGDG